jgi:molybdate transport system substrate-binding protein
MRRLFSVLLVTTLSTLIFCTTHAQGEEQPFHIYAGAGLKKALDPIVAKFHAQGIKPLVNYGPSGGLYAQISQGQPCDIFFSADWRYVVKLQDQGQLVQGHKFITDQVVLVVSKSGAAKVKSNDDVKHEGVVLTVADPRAPVGHYAEQGLKNLGIWEQILSADTLKARPSTVNQVAILIRGDEADAGYIYRSVAKMYGLEPIDVLHDVGGEIVFGVAIVNGGKVELARKFLALAKQNMGEFTQFGWHPYE